MTGLGLDLRFALRRLWGQPLASGLAILTLAFGIGATAAIFSVVQGVLLDPLPYPESDRLVRLFAAKTTQGIEESGLSRADALDLRGALSSLEDVGIWNWHGLDYGLERPRNVATIQVSVGLLDLLGAEPALGRLFQDGEDEEGAGRVVILSWAFWQSELGGDPDVVESQIIFDGEPWTVVGVMPESFAYPMPGEMVWAPWVSPSRVPSRKSRWINTLGRLSDGVSLATAQAELSAFAAGLEAEYPETNEGWTLRAVPLLEDTVGDVRDSLWSLQGGVILLLLIAVANVAGLNLMRSLSRRGELAVRVALGAGRSRVARLLLVESLVVTALGTGAGLLMAQWGLEGIVAASPDSLPRVDEIALDRGLLLSTCLGSLVIGVLVGLVPVLRAVREDVVVGLGETGRSRTLTRSTSRVRSLLVVGELTLSVILLVGASLLGHSLVRTLQTDVGFDTENTVAVQLFAWDRAYSEVATRLDFFDRLTERFEALPGVVSVGRTSSLPFTVLPPGRTTVRVDGRAEEEQEQVKARVVDQGFFETMGIPMLRGRSFDGRDRAGAPLVVLLNRTAAERFFPGEDAIGSRISVGGREAWWEVIGVVEDIRDGRIEQIPGPDLFLPHAQSPTGTMTLVLRTDGEPELVVQRAREAVWEIDLQQSVFSAFSVSELMRGATERRRFLTSLAGLFASLALFLAVVGLYGVLSYSVRSRNRELGIRISVGAQAGDLVGMIASQGLRLIGTGLVAGAVGAALVARTLDGQLYGVEPYDPWSWLGALGVLALVGIAASLVPALRAGRVDPVQVLHET